MVLKYLQSFKMILWQIIPLVCYAQQSQLVAGYLLTLSTRTVCARMEKGIFRNDLTSREDIKQHSQAQHSDNTECEKTPSPNFVR